MYIRCSADGHASYCRILETDNLQRDEDKTEVKQRDTGRFQARRCSGAQQFKGRKDRDDFVRRRSVERCLADRLGVTTAKSRETRFQRAAWNWPSLTPTGRRFSGGFRGCAGPLLTAIVQHSTA